MSAGAVAALLGLALVAPPPPAALPPAGAARPASVAACTKYRVLAEKSELVSDQEVAAWATAALERAALLDKGSPCWVYVRITAAPIRTGGRQDGWHAHVALSTRRYLKDGKLVANERGMLLVEAERGALASRARSVVEEYVAKLGAAGGAAPSDG